MTATCRICLIAWLALSSTRYTQGGGGYIGKVYKKALYFAYTDATFTTRVPRDDSMGFLGPALRAEVSLLSGRVLHASGVGKRACATELVQPAQMRCRGGLRVVGMG